jgi:formylglycine-generating enzyme required for sulfatase activity
MKLVSHGFFFTILYYQGKQVEEKSALLELGIPKHELRAVLNQVAYEAHKEQPELVGTADIPERTLAGLLYATPSRKQEISIERIITYIKNRAGLLEDRGPDQQGQHVYTFPHRTFQEYLAACHLSGATFPQQIAALARRQQDRWREALLLAAARANTPYSVWGLVGKLCSRPEPGNSEEATIAAEEWWGAFLAGQVLLETKLTGPVSDEEDRARRARVRGWHKAILRAGALPPRDRALAGEALAALGDDRPGILTCDEMVFCAVPAGPFWLANWDEEGQGVVYDGLDKPYWIGRYPVTAAQFKEFVEDSGHRPYDQDSLRLPDNWPVVYVNWYDALALANWLDERWRANGWLPAGYRVMLPNEVEWEKAARGGLEIPPEPLIMTAANLKNYQPPQMAENELYRRMYPWGSEREQEGDLYRANNEAAGIGQPCAVGSFPAGTSPYGCLDLSGQVWEWTRSYYGQEFPYRAGVKYETIDDRKKEVMVLRGGAYHQNQNASTAWQKWLFIYHGNMKQRIPRGAKPEQLQVSARQEQILARIIRRAKSPQHLVIRAKIVIQAATAARNTHIANDLQISLPTVRTWRRRWLIATAHLQEVETVADNKVLEEHIVATLSDQPRPGTPATFSAEQICQIIAVACENPAESGRPITEWTPRELADEVSQRKIVESISPRQVGRFLKGG